MVLCVAEPIVIPMKFTRDIRICSAPRRIVAMLLAIFMVVLPFSPCFASCCCDEKSEALAPVLGSDMSTTSHCHSEGNTRAKKGGGGDTEKDCGRNGLSIQSSCPCPELVPPTNVADNSGANERLIKPTVASSVLVVAQQGQPGLRFRRATCVSSSRLPNRDFHLQLCVFRI